MPDIGYLPETRLESTASRGQTARRAALVGAVLGGALLALLATPASEAAQAVEAAGPELTVLLRAMAGMKLLFAAGLLAAVHWRLAASTPTWRLVSYAAAAAAMAAGPVLIWQMAYVRTGALLLHGGLLAGALLLWRDPAVAARLRGLVDRRRISLRAGRS